MTLTAFGAQGLFMEIIFGVTGITVHFGVFERLRLMTLAARGDRMDPDEREFCQIMIEPYLFSPAAVIMAAAAFIALLAFVHVIGLVTTAAFRVDLHIFRFIAVTIAALDLRVTA